MTKENWQPEILCACALRALVDVSAPDTKSGSEGTTYVLSGVDGETRENEDISRTPGMKM